MLGLAFQLHDPEHLLGKPEGEEEALARIDDHAYTLKAARRMTCVRLDLGEKPAVVSAIMKYQATERMRMAATAVQHSAEFSITACWLGIASYGVPVGTSHDGTFRPAQRRSRHPHAKTIGQF